MQILPVNYNQTPHTYKANKANNQTVNTVSNPFWIPFEARVDKRISRFEPFHEQKKRLPEELRSYLKTIEDKLSIKPPEAMKNAYAKLNLAKTIDDVKRLFPNEPLFKHLTTLKDSESKIGIIGIYKKFEDKYKNGILKSGDDFTVYLLRKLFIETKVYQDINDDLDNDLLPDIKDYFRNKYNHNKYIKTEILQGLGIIPAHRDMRNSLKFTKEGYADWFGLIISEALLRRLKNMTEEEKNEEIEKRREGLENWWNSMSYEEKVDLATSVDVQEEGYKSYKRFDNESRKRNRIFINSLPEFMEPEPEQEPEKKVKRSLKLNDKEVYILWMQNNLAKFYNAMSEQEKIAFELERSAKMARKWQEMTPEQRIEYIKSIKEGIEPVRIAMIDAWNHLTTLIRVLREYMLEQQIYKPVELVYDNDEFIKLQSKIMTEFWNQNRDLAKIFGIKMKTSHQKVKEAIENGTYEQFKNEVLAERDERIQKLQEGYKAEEEEIKKNKEEKIKEKEAKIPREDIQYRKEFTECYINSLDKHGLLPPSYKTEMAEIFLDRIPKDLIISYTELMKNNEPVPQEIMEYIRNEQAKNDCPREERIQRALEAAIAAELTSKGATHTFFQKDINSLIQVLNDRYEDRNVPKARRVDKYRIARLYDEFERNLSEKELNTIASSYFNAKRDLTREENDLLENYLSSYGRSLLILFSDKSAYSDSVKFSFNEKFLSLMPKQVKEFIKPFIQTSEDIFEENEINSLVTQIYNRFKYLPDDVLKIYTREVATTIRLDRETHKNNYLNKLKNTFYTKPRFEKAQNFPEFDMKYMSKEEIFKLLAIEQSMADGFNRVTDSEDAYSTPFGQLLSFYDMTSIMKSHDKMTLRNEDGSKRYTIKEKPNTKALYTKYMEYLNAIKTKEEVINPDGTVNKEELLYCLNPVEGESERDLGTMQRIDASFPDTEIQTTKPVKSNIPNQIPAEQYKSAFRIKFAQNINPHNALPNSYVEEIGDIILETFSQEAIEEYSVNPSAKNMFSADALYKNCSAENIKKLNRLQRALEAAIAKELTKTGGTPDLYGMQAEALISLLEQRISEINLPEDKQVSISHLEKQYDYYKQDPEQDRLDYIIENYFASNAPGRIGVNEKEILKDYISEYGRTAYIVFPNSISTTPIAIREALYDKFQTLMPEKVKDTLKPFIKTKEDIFKEYKIAMMRGEISERFEFIPKEALDAYERFVTDIIRAYDKNPNASLKEKYNYSIKNIREKIGRKHINNDGNISIFRMPKNMITDTDTKLKLLAAEQAVADELTRVTERTDMVYKYEIEALATWTETVRGLIKKLGSNTNLAIPFNNGYGAKYIAKEKATSDNIRRNYQKYINNIYENLDTVLNKDGNINEEKLLYLLVSKDDKSEKIMGTKTRIEAYHTETKEDIQQAEPAKSNTESKILPEQLKKEFRIELARNINPNKLLPGSYVKELSDIIFEAFPREKIEEYLLQPAAKNMFTNEVLYKNCSKENLKKLKRIQHALAAAIAAELAAKNGDYSLYGESVDTLISKLEEQEAGFGQKRQNKTDIEHIQELYDCYKKDLSKNDLIYIINNFFYTDHASTKEEDDLIMNYIDEYGRTSEILFSVNISLPLNAKEAFNNKFLNSMPEEVRNVATPLLKTREDLKQNYDIEIVRRQLARRFSSLIPQEPLNIYTREAAKLMRLMNQPDTDPELKERYGIEAFKKSLSHEEDEKDGDFASVLKLPKYYISDNTNKLYMLAIEQAMADELYRVSKNNIVYAGELETLALGFELSSHMKKADKNGLELSDPDTGVTFIFKEKPKKDNIIQKYIKYLKEFEASEDLFLENGELNREEILFCLNPDEKNKDKDEAIKERIDGYFYD